jgi:hypothetical protein
MDATTETAIVERTISIDASPETVWEFFVDPEKLKRWKGVDARLEPRPSRGRRRSWSSLRPREAVQAAFRAPRPPERGRDRVTRGRLGPLPAAARGRGRPRRPGRGPVALAGHGIDELGAASLCSLSRVNPWFPRVPPPCERRRGRGVSGAARGGRSSSGLALLSLPPGKARLRRRMEALSRGMVPLTYALPTSDADRLEDADREQVRDHRAPAHAHERKRNARDRRHSYGHADVDEDL